MTYSYEDYVTRYSDSFQRVVLDPAYVQRISAFVEELIQAKAAEAHHIRDHSQEAKRFTTGFLGEAAIEKLLGLSVIDWSIGPSGLYHHPDIPGYRVGGKTVEKGKFPIIFKDNRYPQIMCIRSDWKPNLIFVCGLATPQVLNQYQDDALILDPKLRARGSKTGFYGYPYLTPIHSRTDLAPYRR